MFTKNIKLPSVYTRLCESIKIIYISKNKYSCLVCWQIKLMSHLMQTKNILKSVFMQQQGRILSLMIMQVKSVLFNSIKMVYEQSMLMYFGFQSN